MSELVLIRTEGETKEKYIFVYLFILFNIFSVVQSVQEVGQH